MNDLNRIIKILILSLFILHSAFAIDDSYKTTLTTLCDALLPTQITDKTNANYGALICPSKNPDVNKIHSRAAEAVYPFAVEYTLTGNTKYRDAAVILGNWLVTIQETTGKIGGWSEDWPDPTQAGWYGTTADQLISLAGAYPIVKPFLSATESANWDNAIGKAADYVKGSFPVSNVNYNAIGGAALFLASTVVAAPKTSWVAKADTLITRNTFDSIGTDNLLRGEGKGVDEGYDMAQSIGYVALYSILAKSAVAKQKAADMLHAHFNFVYPNGSVDNSWGTRSYKWGYESGTKTAPGVYFSFALLADVDPAFGAAGLQCLQYLGTKCLDNGWVTYGPHAHKHASSNPPCNYQTFARAQSIALAIEYAPSATATSPFPAQTLNWYKFFPLINVAVVRTKNIMATVSAYGEIRTYSRNTVPKGGSVSNLWYTGFGDNGYLQSSSATIYTRTETMHMPTEDNPVPLPLTPRIECTVAASYYTNLFETNATMNVTQNSDNVGVTTSGKFTSQTGTTAGMNFTVSNKFFDSKVQKQYSVSGAAGSFKIIEPFVNDSGTVFTKSGTNTVAITPKSGPTWTLTVDSATVPYSLTTGTDSSRYWCPFPGIEAYPAIIAFTTTNANTQTITLSISGPANVPSMSIATDGKFPNATPPLKLFPRKNGMIGIQCHLDKEAFVVINAFSMNGKHIATPYAGHLNAGVSTIGWNGKDPANRPVTHGICICSMKINGVQAALDILRL